MNAKLTAAFVFATFSAVSAQAADPITEYARINQNSFASDTFVAGKNSPVGTVTEAGSKIYWFNSDTNSYSSALGGSETLLSVANPAALRAYGANTAGSSSYENTLAKLTTGSANYASMGWSIDLGANLLKSDIAGYKVSGSSISVIDFGNTGSSQVVSYDFKVGLWNGSQLSFANGLNQLSFELGTNAGAGGNVSYLGNDIFRFTETGTSSGTTLTVSSATQDQWVRSFVTTAFAREGTAAFTGDYVDLRASRNLSAVSPVPEPASALLLVLGLAGLTLVSRANKARQQQA